MEADPPLLSLRLLVPPLRLLTAFMWQVAHDQNVEHFGKLEAFASVVLKILPDLLSSRQKVTLIMGLRTKMLLEMCRSDVPVNPKSIRSQLSEIQSRHLKTSTNSKLDNMQSHLLELVAKILEDPVEKEYFFKRVYPVEYGPDFDKALQVLVGYFISRLEKFLPVPNFKQVSSWVDSASLWEECEQHLSQLKHLHTLSQNNNYHGDLGETDLPSIVEDRIMSSLTFQDSGDGDHRLNNLESMPSQGVESPSSHKPQDEDGHQKLHRHDKSLKNFNASTSKASRVSDAQKQAGPSVNKNLGDVYDEEDTGFSLNMETVMPEETPHQSSVPSVGLGRDLVKTPKAPEGVSSVSLNKDKNRASVVTTSEHPLLRRGGEQASSLLGRAVLQTVVPLELVTVIQVDQHSKENLTVPLSQQPQTASLPQQKIVLVLSDVSSTNNTKQAVKVLPSHNAPGSPNLTNQKIVPMNRGKFKCLTCGTAFASLSKWRLHRQSHMADKTTFKCVHCSREFRLLSALIRHQQVQPDLEDPSLPPCLQPKRNPASASTNLQINPLSPNKKSTKIGQDSTIVPIINRAKFKCVTCGMAFASLAKWRLHRKSHVTDKTTFKCVHCSREFKNLSGLRCHQQVRADLEDPSLPPCLQPKRKRARPSVRPNPGQCRYCGETFPGADELGSHLKTHLGIQPYQCKQCNKRFTTHSSYWVHMETHKGEKPYLCSDCGKQYCTLLQLKAHMKLHSAVGGCCPYCGKQFSSRGNLTVHIRQHTGEKPYVCSVCEKAFNSAGTLQVHMRIHTGERPYKCQVCGLGCLTSGARLVHMRLHSGERPFACNYCDKKFNTGFSLKSHMHVHTGMKPFKCSICPKSYITRNHLNRHLQTHLTAKP